jgi:regulator of chromosome condensation
LASRDHFTTVPAAGDGAVLPTEPLPAVAGAGNEPLFVASWGTGDCDQLGHGDEEYTRVKPRLLRALGKVRMRAIAVGGLHTLALSDAGAVWSWGCNDDAALGRKGAENLPGRVRGLLNDVPVKAIAAGDSHSLALTADGRVYAWGTYKGADGYLGFDATTQKAASPHFMSAVWEGHGPAVTLSSGADHSAVRLESGGAVVWGYGGQGQLGHTVTEVRLRGNRTNKLHLSPHVLALTKGELAKLRKEWDGGVGAGGGGGGGGGSSASGTPSRTTPSRATPGRRGRAGAGAGAITVQGVWACGFSTFVTFGLAGSPLGVPSRTYACGLNSYGQLGIGDTENQAHLVEVEALRDVPCGVRDMVGGSQHTLVLTGGGAVLAMGRADSGQLGLSSTPHGRLPIAASSFVPRHIAASAFGGSPVAAITASACTSGAVTVDGRAYAWGFGESSQLGSHVGEDENMPHAITGKAAGDMADARVLAIGMGGQHAVALAVAGPKAAAILSSAEVAGAPLVEDPEAVETDEAEEGAAGEAEGGDDDGMGGAGSEAGGEAESDDDTGEGEDAEAEPVAAVTPPVIGRKRRAPDAAPAEEPHSGGGGGGDSAAVEAAAHSPAGKRARVEDAAPVPPADDGGVLAGSGSDGPTAAASLPAAAAGQPDSSAGGGGEGGSAAAPVSPPVPVLRPVPQPARPHAFW